MRTDNAGLALIKGFEGLRLNAYRCSAGILTIGYGSTRHLNGQPVKQGDKLLNEAEALSLLKSTLARFENAVAVAVKVPLSQNQFNALVSFAYNVGTGAFGASTLLRKLNAGDYKGAADQFLVWNKITDPATGTKKPLAALTTRRNKERTLFLAA